MTARFVAKRDARRLWGVYDRVMASWPARRPETGKVRQNTRDQAVAEAEAARLNRIYGGA